MRLSQLHIRNFRSIESMELRPHNHLNVIVGDNGAGKTSILEAMHLMAYGRSFRGKPSDGLIRHGADELEVFVEWYGGSDSNVHRAGLRHNGKDWTGRLDGENVASLSVLCSALAVVTFEPESAQLITGSAEGRRRFIDWGLFHVEPRFLPVWRRYSRALKQRNALLKQNASNSQLDAWDRELASTGTEVNSFRRQYVTDLLPLIRKVSATIAPSVTVADAQFSDGWRSDQMDLADALLLQRDRDRLIGHTSVGPHRADFQLQFEDIAHRDHLSRGQAKLAALSALLGQGKHLSLHHVSPIIALDDIASELDPNHQERVMAAVRQGYGQIWITEADKRTYMSAFMLDEYRRFHVEHGRLVEG